MATRKADRPSKPPARPAAKTPAETPAKKATARSKTPAKTRSTTTTETPSSSSAGALPTVSERRETLEQIAVWLKAELAEAKGSALAAVSKELRNTMRDLESLPVTRPQGTPLDEIAAKRAARGAATPDSPSTGRRRQPRRSNGSHRAG